MGSPIERTGLRPSCSFCPKCWSFECSLNEKHASPGSQRMHAQNPFFRSGTPPPISVYLGRHWRHLHNKMDQAFPLRFCILQAINNCTVVVGRPKNKATAIAYSQWRTWLMEFTANLQFVLVSQARPTSAKKKKGRIWWTAYTSCEYCWVGTLNFYFW